MTKDINHAERAHAKLSPSAMGRIMKCPGSVILSENVVEKTSEFAEEGTKAHEWAEIAGRNLLLNEGYTGRTEQFDEDMIHYGNEYGKFLKYICSKFKPNKPPFFEARVAFNKDIWGTVDFLACKENKGSFDLLVVDYKYGQGVEVGAEDNAQLKTYIAAATREIEGKTDLPLRKAYAYIYQPRVGEKPYNRAVYTGEEIREWSTKLEDVQRKVSDVVRGAYTVDEMMSAEGLDHCRFCPAKYKCPAFLKETRGAALVEMDAEVPKIPAVDELTVEQRVRIFKAKKAVEQYLKDVEHSLLAEAMEGADIPGYKVVSGISRRKWLDNEKKVISKLRRLGIKTPYKKSLIGIGDAEKLIEGSKKEVGAKLVNITFKPPGKMQLAAETDKRTAIAFSSKEDAIAIMDDE